MVAVQPKQHIRQLGELFKFEGGKELRKWMLEQGLFRGIVYAEPGAPEEALRTLLYYLTNEPECVETFSYDVLNPHEEIEYIYAIRMGCEGDLSTYLIVVYGRHASAKTNIIAISYPP